MLEKALSRALTRKKSSDVRVNIMSETRRSDSCRICKRENVSGKQLNSSSQNLFKPSQRKDSFGIVLADVCKQLRLSLLDDPEVYSDRVCNPRGRKIILSLCNLF